MPEMPEPERFDLPEPDPDEPWQVVIAPDTVKEGWTTGDVFFTWPEGGIQIKLACHRDDFPDPKSRVMTDEEYQTYLSLDEPEKSQYLGALMLER